VATYSATTTLPYEHLERATAELRGQLRLQLPDAGDGGLPDWSTLTVTGPVMVTDGFRRTGTSTAPPADEGLAGS
jgi:hypothetical protein